MVDGLRHAGAGLCGGVFVLLGSGEMKQEMQMKNETGSDLKQYLGDGVYADFDGWMIRLMTENDESVSNEIFLEPSVLSALIKYAETVASKSADEKEH